MESNGTGLDWGSSEECNLTEDSSNGFCNMTSEGSNGNSQEMLLKVVAIVVPILFSIIVVVGLVGNALVVLVVALNKTMHNTTNILIVNLAVSDLMFIVFCVPFTATDYFLPSWPFGGIWCKMVQYLVHVTAYASVYTLVLMSIDRYLAVVHPITSMSLRTENNTSLAIILMWVSVSLGCIPLFLAHDEFLHHYHHGPSFVCRFNRDIWNKFIYQMTFGITGYLVPLVVIIILYFFVLKKVVFGTGGHQQTKSANTNKRKQNVTRMCIMVIVLFAICWGPIHIILNLKNLKLIDVNTLTISFQITAQVLAYMNSCVNPILYAFLSENFRTAFRKIIYCFSSKPDNRNLRGNANSTKRSKITNIGNTNETKDSCV